MRNNGTIEKGEHLSMPTEFKKGQIPHNFKGWRMSNGYKDIYLPTHPNSKKSGHVAEHRLVMEKYIGRYLDRKEVVHHKNGMKSDNRIENLELIESTNEHTRMHTIGRSRPDCQKHILIKSFPLPKPEKEGDIISLAFQRYETYKVSRCQKCNELFWHFKHYSPKYCCSTGSKHRKIYWEK